MRRRESELVKKRNRGDTRGDPKHWHCLNEEHVLGPARNVNVRELRFHLAIHHGISVKDSKTALQLGKLHLLAHALLAHEELRELLGIGEKWEYK